MPDIIVITWPGVAKGVVRCDRIMVVERNDRFWGAFIERLDDAILGTVRQGIVAAIAL